MVRPSPRGVSLLLVTLVSVTLTLAACGSGDDADEPAGSGGDAPESALLAADLQRSTLFDTRREFGLSLAALGDTDLQLESVQLATPLFEAVAPTLRDPVLHAGDAAVVMPLPYGTAICDDAGSDGTSGDADAATGSETGDDADGEGDDEDDRRASAQVVAVVDGEEVLVPLTVHPEDMLELLHERECATAAVLDDVELALDGDWAVVDPTTATGRLTVTQRSPGVTAEIDELLGNVILGVTTEATAPALTVDDTTPTASVGVTVSASRCDPHALTEYKRTFVFVALVHVDDASSDDDTDESDENDGDAAGGDDAGAGDEPVRVDVRAEGPAHAALGQILTSCVG